MKTVVVIFLLSFVMVGCKSTSLETQMTSQQRESLENLYEYEVKPQFISFVVKSTGCTRKEDFELLHNQYQGRHEFALIRLKPDLCKAMPRAFPVTYRLDEFVNDNNEIKVLNSTNQPVKPVKKGKQG